MKFERLIRLSPRIFVFAAGLDLVKQLLWVAPYWLREREVGRVGEFAALDPQFKLEMADRILGLVLYPLGWLATAIIVTLLLAIYDQHKQLEPAE
ncbi:MAG: hypothetical protein JOZ20_07790 [Sphingomonas sp.]|nr:hypothetical protein [Sphingomonas sp.]